MLLQTTFLSPLFERSSTDLQSAEPSALAPSSATTDHHSSSAGPMSANVPVPNGSWYRSGSAMSDRWEMDSRIQTKPPPGCCWAQSSLPPPFLRGSRFLLCLLSSTVRSRRRGAHVLRDSLLPQKLLRRFFPLLAPARAASLPGSPRRPPKLENETFARWDQTFPVNKGSRTPPSAR